MNIQNILAVASIALLFGQHNQISTSKVVFTSLKCKIVDPTFARFEYCDLKSINRTTKFMSIYTKLLKLPVTNFSANLSIMRKFNRYQTVFNNVSIDGCRFLKSGKNELAQAIFNLWKSYSNVNRSCPIDYDIQLKDFPNTFQLPALMSMLDGDYVVYTGWYAYGIRRANIIISVHINGRSQ